MHDVEHVGNDTATKMYEYMYLHFFSLSDNYEDETFTTTRNLNSMSGGVPMPEADSSVRTVPPP